MLTVFDSLEHLFFFNTEFKLNNHNINKKKSMNIEI